MTDIFGWRSGLASLILNWCLVLTLLFMWWVNLFWYIRGPWIRLLRIRCWRRRCWICKTFPEKPCVSQMLGGPFWRLGIPMERLSIPPGTGWGGKDTGWLSTWECPLRTDSASWKSIESIIQLFSFRNSCILPVSSRIVSRSSTNFLLAIVSTVEPWNRFNSSISLRLCSRASRRSQFCFNNSLWRRSYRVEEVVDLVDVVRLRDEHDKFLLFLRLDRFIQFLNTSSIVIGLEFVFSNLCLTVSENLLFFCLSRRVLICHSRS